jgi:hypothetical protein
VQVDVGEEHLFAGELDVMKDADVADVPAWPGGADGLHHGLLGADCLDHRVCAEPAREFLDPGHPLVPSLLDDVGRPELEGELLSWLVAAHGDDPFRAEVPRGKHGEQADCAITTTATVLPGPASAATAPNQHEAEAGRARRGAVSGTRGGSGPAHPRP